MNTTRCAWVGNDQLMIDYHDNEWGVPVYDDRKIFEFLVLESAQAGLSWKTILNKREGYRKLFSGFDPQLIAEFDILVVEKLLLDPSIIRNRKKIEATINNAKKFIEVQREFGSFSTYMWKFVDGSPIDGKRSTLKDIPSVSAEAEIFAKDLKKRGFQFLGPTTIYAHMQAVGMVNDHILQCDRYHEIKKLTLK